MGAGAKPLAPRPPLILHAWSDYVPATFVEPNSYLIEDPRFDSLNLVASLWDNGKAVDEYTIALNRRQSKNLVNPSFFFRLGNRITKGLRWWQFRRFCVDTSRQFGGALLHSHFGTTGCELGSVIEELQIPHVITLYGYDGSAALRDAKLVAKYRSMFRTATKIVVLCEEVKNRLLNLGCEPQKVAVWNMPAGVENYPYQARVPGKTVRLVMAARFAEAKGHKYLLEAMQILAREGQNIHLTLVGYGNLTETIRAQITELGLDAFITLIDNKLAVDFTSSYRQILEASDIYVLPSVRDRFGTDEAGPSLTMVCAQAAGLPVISTPFPGSEISVIEGKTGLFCREEDSASLADKIRYLINHPEKWNTLGKAGSELVNREFSEFGQMEKLVGIYQEALGISPPAPLAEKQLPLDLPVQEIGLHANT